MMKLDHKMEFQDGDKFQEEYLLNRIYMNRIGKKYIACNVRNICEG